MSTFFANDGTPLFYRDWGQGKPMLFLASLGMGSQMWDYQFAAFADAGWRCIGLDRRGHGRSDQPRHGYDFDALADDIAALITSLDLTDVTVIAHSMGCAEAIRYLSRHGKTRVARVVLLAPITPKLLQDHDNPGGLPRAGFQVLWDQWQRDYPKWIADNLSPFFIPETSAAMMEWGARQLTASVPVVVALSRAMVNEDFRAEMREIDLPCLLIHGDRDRSAPLEATAKPSAELLRGCRFLVYPGAPHGLMYTHTDRLHADILEFIQES